MPVLYRHPHATRVRHNLTRQILRQETEIANRNRKI
jgi:hypothetical protein